METEIRGFLKVEDFEALKTVSIVDSEGRGFDLRELWPLRGKFIKLTITITRPDEV